VDYVQKAELCFKVSVKHLWETIIPVENGLKVKLKCLLLLYKFKAVEYFFKVMLMFLFDRMNVVHYVGSFYADVLKFCRLTKELCLTLTHKFTSCFQNCFCYIEDSILCRFILLEQLDTSKDMEIYGHEMFEAPFQISAVNKLAPMRVTGGSRENRFQYRGSPVGHRTISFIGGSVFME
jgi:hypothetical protein